MCQARMRCWLVQQFLGSTFFSKVSLLNSDEGLGVLHREGCLTFAAKALGERKSHLGMSQSCPPCARAFGLVSGHVPGPCHWHVTVSQLCPGPIHVPVMSQWCFCQSCPCHVSVMLWSCNNMYVPHRVFIQYCFMFWSNFYLACYSRHKMTYVGGNKQCKHIGSFEGLPLWWCIVWVGNIMSPGVFCIFAFASQSAGRTCSWLQVRLAGLHSGPRTLCEPTIWTDLQNLFTMKFGRCVWMGNFSKMYLHLF